MRSTSVITVLFIFAIMAASAAQAAEWTDHSPRFRLNAHARMDVVPNLLDVRAHAIYGGGGLAYAGIGWHPTAWLTIEPAIGWHFGSREANLAVFITIDQPAFWSFCEFEYQNHTGYYFGQIEYKLISWLHIGAETDGWGELDTDARWSHGGGPNLIFTFGRLSLDVAYHIREIDEHLGGQLFIRLNIHVMK